MMADHVHVPMVGAVNHLQKQSTLPSTITYTIDSSIKLQRNAFPARHKRRTPLPVWEV